MSLLFFKNFINNHFNQFINLLIKIKIYYIQGIINNISINLYFQFSLCKICNKISQQVFAAKISIQQNKQWINFDFSPLIPTLVINDTQTNQQQRLKIIEIQGWKINPKTNYTELTIKSDKIILFIELTKMYDEKTSKLYDQKSMNQFTAYLKNVVASIQIDYFQPKFCIEQNNKINSQHLQNETMIPVHWGYIKQQHQFYSYAGEAYIEVCSLLQAKNLGLNEPCIILADKDQQKGISASLSLNNQAYIDKQNNILFVTFDQQSKVPAKIQFASQSSLQQFYIEYQKLLIESIQKTQYFEDETDMNYILNGASNQSQIQFYDVQQSRMYETQVEYDNFNVDNSQILKSINNKIFLSTQHFDGNTQTELAILDKYKQKFGQKVKLTPQQNEVAVQNGLQIGFFDVQQHQLQNIIDLKQKENINDFSMCLDTTTGEIMQKQIKSENALLGINNDSIFMIDKRLPGNQAQIGEIVKKTAAKKGEHFELLLVTQKGNIIVCNQQGNLSIYKNIEGKKATNVLPGCGQVASSIWCDSQEKYIIACYGSRVYIHNAISVNDESMFYKTIKKTDRQPMKMIVIGQDLMARYSVNDDTISAYMSHGKIIVCLSKALIIYDWNQLINNNIYEYDIVELNQNDNCIGGGLSKQNNIIATQKTINNLNLD